jgi:hypothetical protein
MADRVAVVASPEVITAMPPGVVAAEYMIVVDSLEVTAPVVVAEMGPFAEAVAAVVVPFRVVVMLVLILGG